MGASTSSNPRDERTGSCNSCTVSNQEQARAELEPKLYEQLEIMFEEVREGQRRAGDEPETTKIEDTLRMWGMKLDDELAWHLETALKMAADESNTDAIETFVFFWLLVKDSGLSEEDMFAIVKSIRKGEAPDVKFSDPDNWNGLLCEVRVSPLNNLTVIAC
mmetsp:Transcript_29462/g.60335  ORF Transcript_29462/g.60335 Transcript_29462/m.60335 type:complete len:162 (-) Transcript_29462:19-504(-)